MIAVLSQIIVAVAVAAPQAVAPAVDGALLECGFEEPSDVDFDGWPDGWTRRTGPGYPHYVPIRIVPAEGATGRACLRIDLDSGGAAAVSPLVRVDARHAYTLRASIKTVGLVHDSASAAVTFFDQDRRPLWTETSRRVSGGTDWSVVEIGPLNDVPADAHYATVRLQLEPGEGADLHGSAFFDDVSLCQLPRIVLSTADPYRLLVTTEAVTISGQISGVGPDFTGATFDLEDVQGKQVLDEQVAWQHAGAAPADHAAAPSSAALVAAGEGAFDVTWSPPIRSPGFYRVGLKLRAGERVVAQRQIALALVEPAALPAAGEFGWTLPRGEAGVRLPDVARLAAAGGIHWLKFPMWYDAEDADRAAALTTLVDQLASQGITAVGLLAHPGEKVVAKLNVARPREVANLFAAQPADWYPTLEPVQVRMALKVPWWQLGDDDDTSFAGTADVAARLATVKSELDKIAQDTRLGLAWPWGQPLPAPPPAWRFVARPAPSSAGAEELARGLAESTAAATPQWLSIKAPARGEGDAPQRAIELVRRMIAAKTAGAAAIFFNGPLDSERGLLRDDGTVDELFLPWRTTALALAGGTSVGSIVLAGGSENQIFVRGGQPTLVAWNQQRVQERIFLGDAVEQTDIWGRRSPVAGTAEQNAVQVGPSPVFVTGLDPLVLNWRLANRLSASKIPAVLGEPHRLSFTVRNVFDAPVEAKARLVPPVAWRVYPAEFEFKAKPGAETTQAFELVLPPTAPTGDHLVRLDFAVAAERPYRFSVFQVLRVGLDDVELSVAAALDARGDVEVRQKLVNHTEQPVSFRCHLFAPDRRRMRTQVLDLGRGEKSDVYRLPQARDLLGRELWIRAEEINGNRTLNRRVVVRAASAAAAGRDSLSSTD